MNEAKPFLEILGEMEDGDIIISSRSTVGVIRRGVMFYYYDTRTREQHEKIIIDMDAIHTKYKFYNPYVDWREAFEAYENGHTIMAEFDGEMVWFNRDIVTLEEHAFLTSKELIGLLTTKWIIKEVKKPN